VVRRRRMPTPAAKRTAAAPSIIGCLCTQADPLRILEAHRVPLKSVPISSALSESVLKVSRLAASTHLITPQSVSDSTETRCRLDRRPGEILFASGGLKTPFRVLSPLSLVSAFPKDASKRTFHGTAPHPKSGARVGVFRLRARKHPRKYPQVELIAKVRVR
jgi:hypothetical protein